MQQASFGFSQSCTAAQLDLAKAARGSKYTCIEVAVSFQLAFTAATFDSVFTLAMSAFYNWQANVKRWSSMFDSGIKKASCPPL